MNGSTLRTYRQAHELTHQEFAELLEISKRQLIRLEKGESDLSRSVVAARYHALVTSRSGSTDQPAFRFIDLFAGIGGFRLGFESVGGQCVFTSEWNKYARKTYQANFDVEHAIAGDITEVPAHAVPPHDVLVAGFPCQPFSIAGVSKKNSLGRPHGFADETQGTLFFDVARILEVHRPAAFVLENVKNLLSHDRGRTMQVILRVLREELGYNVEYRVIDARSFLPQHRERIFIVGFSERTKFSLEDCVSVPPKEEGPSLSRILHPEDGTEVAEEPFTEGSSAEVAAKYTLSDKLWQYLQDYAEKHRKKGNGFGFGLVTPEDVARTLSARYYKDGSEILVAQDGNNPRRLTPRECARLMGFDDARRRFVIPVSDTQAYKQFGNAVAVPVVERIAEGMRPYIQGTAGAPSNQTELFALA